jgi:hypothetical protein
MAISYPLALPSTSDTMAVEMRAINAVATGRSPYTFASQQFAYSGEMWAADLTLKPMRRSNAEKWVAFLLSLRGSYGTFLLGDPFSCAPRGTQSAGITVTGAAEARSLTVIMAGSLLAGDYIQIGTGSESTLHKVLADKTGSGTLEIWPALRKTRTGVAAATTNTVGLFRLATNETAWTVDNLATFGITIPAVEAI